MPSDPKLHHEATQWLSRTALGANVFLLLLNLFPNTSTQIILSILLYGCQDSWKKLRTLENNWIKRNFLKNGLVFSYFSQFSSSLSEFRGLAAKFQGYVQLFKVRLIWVMNYLRKLLDSLKTVKNLKNIPEILILENLETLSAAFALFAF